MTAAYSSLNLLLLGPPGSGKSTQAERLAASYRVPLISTRDMLRNEVLSETSLGREIREEMERGELVSDRLLAGLVLQRLDREDCARGMILDGYPRTVAQAALLDGILAELGRSIERAVLIDVPPEVGVTRLVADDRSTSDLAEDGGQRERMVREQLRVWQLNAPELKEFYSNRGLLLEVDGDRSVDEVSDVLFRAVAIPVGA